MSKKLSIFARLMILVMCLALVFCGCKKSEETPAADPKDEANSEVGGAIDKTLGGLLGGDGSLDVIGDALTCGKITISVGDMAENVLYINSNAGTFADILKVNAQGQEIVVNLYGDNGEIAVKVPAVLGDTAYGLNLNTLMEDLKNSPIWEMTGMSFEDLEKQLGIDFDEVMNSVSGTMETISGSIETIFDKIMAHVDVTTTQGKVTVNGTEVDATIITYSFDEQDLKNIAFDLIDWAVKLVEDMAKELSDSLGSVMFGEFDVEDLMGQMNVDEIKNQVTEALESIDMEFSLAMNINASTGYLMSANALFDATIEGVKGSVYADLVLGVDPSTSNKYTLDVGGASPEGEKAGFLVTIDRDLDQAVQVTTLTVARYYNTESVNILTGSLTYNTSNYEFVLAGEAGRYNLRVDGMFKATDKVLELGVDKVALNDEVTNVDLTVKFETINGSEVPKMPSYKNPLKMNMAELMELLQGLGLGGAPEYPDYDYPNYEYPEFDDEDWY